jgi:putative ABC transport system permease protein
MTEERKVVVLGKQLYTELFGAADPLGKYIQIKGVYFQVVGVLVSLKGGDDGDRMNSTAYVPLTTFQGAFNQRDRVGWFALTARRDLPASVVEENVRRTLLDLHHIHPDDSQAIGSFNLADKFERIQKLFGAIRGFIWFVGTLTLLAGVLGVSNILLIIVKERTKEIGIRKALGATPASLIALVLEESLVLTGLSGYAGVAFGVFVLELVGRAVKNLKGAPLSEPAVNLQAALVASFVLIVAGLVAGVVPARHAARIHPVEALRSE